MPHNAQSPARKIKAVALDVFGTLVEITDKRRPYRKLAPTCDAPTSIGRVAMTQDLGLAGLAHSQRSTLTLAELGLLEQDLYAELASVRLFPEVATVLQQLRNQGYRLAIVSNLAAPYAVPVKLLLPFALDVYAWSFERGAVKPEREIYRWVTEHLGLAPDEILMVGDTHTADYAGARAHGFQALYLDRKGASSHPDTATIRDLTGVLTYLGLAPA